jgi:hypothetical protein
MFMCSRPTPKPTTEEGGEMKIRKAWSREPTSPLIRTLRPTVITLAAILLVVAGCEAVTEPEPIAHYAVQDERFRASEPEEVVLGELEPEREPGRINDLAAPECASRSGSSRDERSGSPGCSAEAQSTGPLQGGNPAFKAGPGCAIQCIISGVAHARGAGARLVVNTDTNARFTLIIWNEDLGYWAIRHSELPRTTSWGTTFLDLEANTTYQALVQAEDVSGYVSQATGQFTTLRRFAEVDFAGFTLDSYASENMSFRFFFSVDWAWQPNLEEHWTHPYLPASLPGVRSVTLEDAPQWLQVAVQVMQTIPQDICEGMVFPRDFPGVSGTHNCYTWDTAFNTVDLDNRPAGATSWTEWTQQHHLKTAGFEPGETLYSPLDFTAPVTVKVWFEPAT